MRRPIIAFVCLFVAVAAVFARSLPLTAKELSLMLRGGFSNATLMEELSQRHFVGALSLADEQMLRKCGASENLITRLNEGRYAVPPDQSAAAEKQLAEVAERRIAEAARAQKLDAEYQAKVARERSAKAGTPQPGGKIVVADALKGALVRLQSDSLVPVNDEHIAAKKLIALYFSAHWCGPCRRFTPDLVDYYNRNIGQHPEVEFVFVSNDRTADAMQSYMRETKMPWPAIDFAKLRNNPVATTYAGKGIPSLVLVDATGRVVSNSFDGEQYVGPQKVLGDLDRIFASTGGPVASVH